MNVGHLGVQTEKTLASALQASVSSSCSSEIERCDIATLRFVLPQHDAVSAATRLIADTKVLYLRA